MHWKRREMPWYASQEGVMMQGFVGVHEQGGNLRRVKKR